MKVVLCLFVAAYGVAAGVPRMLRGCGDDSCCALSAALAEPPRIVVERHCPLCPQPAEDGADRERGPGGLPCCPPGCLCCLVLPPCDVPGQSVELPVREGHGATVVPFGAPACGPIGLRDPVMRRVALDSGPPRSVMRSLRSWRLVI
jgi:hypothetical protein